MINVNESGGECGQIFVSISCIWKDKADVILFF